MSDPVHEAGGPPADHDLPAPAGEAATPAHASGSPEQRLAEAKVVLLLADEANLEMVEAFLTEAGYRNHIGAADRGDAFDLLFNERPDVVLLDLGLGQGVGLDILSWMQTDRILRHVPVIALAESDDRATRLRALELGAAVFLRKPVDGAELILRLRNTLAAKIWQDGLAFCDPLTGLANRERFLDRLDWALRHARRYGTTGAVLQIGIDRFKQINEALGPGVGDRVLRTVAQRLEQCVRESDLVARSVATEPGASLSRLGGDEFTALLPVVAHTESIAHVAQRILEQTAAPMTVDDRELFLTCCVGIAVFPNDGTAKDAVLRDAGIAMRHAKQWGRDSFHYYSAELNAKSLQRLSLESDLRRAMQRDELMLYYQPKFDVVTGRLTGAEALLRWQHPERGMVSPGEFVPVAEETGLIMPLGDRVLQIACAQVATWRAAGLEPPRIAVNVSSHQFRRRSFGQEVILLLGDSDVGGQGFTVEMTESAVMENAAESVRVLSGLKEAGIRLSIDDFGTGYSSLSYLKRFPLDEIKIDRSFLAEIDRDKDSIAIATAIIAMSHGLGFRVVAEGVETEHQLAFLREQRCDECQGFLTGRPMPADAFAALLASGGRPAAGFPAEDPPAGERERAALRLVQAGEAAR